MTKEAVFQEVSLKQDFFEVCQVLGQFSCSRTLTDTLFKELLSRVINTMMNSLLKTAALLDRIRMNKGVDVDVALRDKLKVYASERLPL